MLSTWSFSERGHRAAWAALAAGGSSLDAAETVGRTAEADPAVDSVGYGGLPDREGIVSLDASVMLSPRECGSVCHVRHYLHAVSIARRVMEATPHVMLAGDGAEAFAASEGFETAPLLSDAARDKWLAWRAAPGPVDQSRDSGLRPIDVGGGEGALFRGASEADWAGHDTVGVLCADRTGRMAGACSTSGAPYKRPGRVGDSPIIGHGLYVDPDGGGATATGTGELVMGLCSSFAVVESMRRGASPSAAITHALERIRDSGPLRDEHQVAIIALRPDGAWAAGALRPGFKSVYTDESGTIVRDPDVVLLER